jgi:hypothetical protein
MDGPLQRVEEHTGRQRAAQPRIGRGSVECPCVVHLRQIALDQARAGSLRPRIRGNLLNEATQLSANGPGGRWRGRPRARGAMSGPVQRVYHAGAECKGAVAEGFRLPRGALQLRLQPAVSQRRGNLPRPPVVARPPDHGSGSSRGGYGGRRIADAARAVLRSGLGRIANLARAILRECSRRIRDPPDAPVARCAAAPPRASGFSPRGETAKATTGGPPAGSRIRLEQGWVWRPPDCGSGSSGAEGSLPVGCLFQGTFFLGFKHSRGGVAEGGWRRVELLRCGATG